MRERKKQRLMEEKKERKMIESAEVMKKGRMDERNQERKEGWNEG